MAGITVTGPARWAVHILTGEDHGLTAADRWAADGWLMVYSRCSNIQPLPRIHGHEPLALYTFDGFAKRAD